MQHRWCTGYKLGGCYCSHPSSARERLLYRRCSLVRVPTALQRVGGLRPRLVRSLGSGEVEGSPGSLHAADGLSRRHRYRGGCLRTKAVPILRHTPPTGGPRQLAFVQRHCHWPRVYIDHSTMVIEECEVVELQWGTVLAVPLAGAGGTYRLVCKY